MSNIQLILNCFPPTNQHMPSIGCEILRAYLKQNNISDSKLIYWNHLFNSSSINSKDALIETDNDITQILPFIKILFNKHDYIKNRVLLKMQETLPSLITISNDYYSEKLEDQIQRIYKIIDTEIEKFDTDKQIIFAVNGKFDSWIPGIVVAQEIKKRKPNAICILGGIEDEGAITELFKEFSVFDFAIWGEGEIPLKMLIDKINNSSKEINNIPRLLTRNNLNYRQNKNILKDSFLNLHNYPQIDYSNYLRYAKGVPTNNILLPIETSRACRWEKCNFCALSWGNKYRVRDFSSVVSEIKEHYTNYGITSFFFVDNDIVGRNIKTFTIFLDKLIDLSQQLEVDFNFHADILHLKFNKNLIKKLSLAGFKSIQIGYEGISDSMLKKLNKSTSFAENILFVKFAQKYDIEITITGLIVGIPNEDENDVYESISNLHFLRFFLGKEKKDLQHRFSELMLFHNTKFWKMMSNNERESYNKHPLNEFLPQSLISNKHISYSLLGQWKTPLLMDKWHSLKKISDNYEESNYQYYLIENNNTINYQEYRNNILINSITFNDSIYWDILKYTNDHVRNLTEIMTFVAKKYENYNKEQIIDIINELRTNHLIYTSKDYQKIITIINTDEL